MKHRRDVGLALVGLLASAWVGNAAQAATATGTVHDASGQPVAGATVLVHSAGVRKGYSTYCPTCYVDCGKRATTDASGGFTIDGLDDELVFNLIVLRDGHTPAWIRTLDPQKGAAAPAVLKAHASIADDRRVLGRLVDSTGRGVPDAVVEVVGVVEGRGGRMFGGFSDGLAVSDAQGWFEMAGDLPMPAGRPFGPSTALMLEVKPRGMAPALHTAAVGKERAEIRISDGATVHGRLMSRGKPVPNAQLILLTLTRASGETFSPMYIGTDEKGRFAITNVPVGRVWTLDANSDSLAGVGATTTRYVATQSDGEVVDVGDVQVNRGFTLSGRVVLSDGSAIAPNMRVAAYTEQGGNRTAILAPDGSFEFTGMAGPYTLSASVRGYRRPEGAVHEVLVTRDTKGIVITLEPQPAPAVPPAAPAGATR